MRVPTYCTLHESAHAHIIKNTITGAELTLTAGELRGRLTSRGLRTEEAGIFFVEEDYRDVLLARYWFKRVYCDLSFPLLLVRTDHLDSISLDQGLAISRANEASQELELQPLGARPTGALHVGRKGLLRSHLADHAIDLRDEKTPRGELVLLRWKRQVLANSRWINQVLPDLYAQTTQGAC